MGFDDRFLKNVELLFDFMRLIHYGNCDATQITIEKPS